MRRDCGRYVGTIPAGVGAVPGAMANQPFEWTVEQGRLSFTNTGAAQPIICDGVASLPGAPGGQIGDGVVTPNNEPTTLNIEVVINAADVSTVTIAQQLAMRTAVSTRLAVELSRVTLTLTGGSVSS